MNSLEKIFREKFGEEERAVLRRIISPKLADDAEKAFEMTVNDGVPVGMNSIDVELMKTSFPVVLIYANRRGEDDFDVLLTIDLSNAKAPMMDTLAGNNIIRNVVGRMLATDSTEFGKLNEEGKASSYMLKLLCEWVERNNSEVHFLFKLHDEVDEELHTMVN